MCSARAQVLIRTRAIQQRCQHIDIAFHRHIVARGPRCFGCVLFAVHVHHQRFSPRWINRWSILLQ